MRQSWASASRAFPSSASPSTDERIRLQRVVKKRPVFPAPSAAASGDMELILSQIASTLKPNAGGGERPAFSSRNPSRVAGRELPFRSTGRPGDPGEEAALALGRRAARRAAPEAFAAERSPADSRDKPPEGRLSIATNVLRKSQAEVLGNIRLSRFAGDYAGRESAIFRLPGRK